MIRKVLAPFRVAGLVLLCALAVTLFSIGKVLEAILPERTKPRGRPWASK